MRFGRWLRRYLPETLLFMAVALPWLSLFALGLLWLWQGGRVWVWAMAAAALGLLAWPLSVSVRRRANEEARLALGDLAAPSTGWYAVERDAWAEVLAIADATAPFSFTATEPLVAKARDIVEAVAHRFHPETHMAWARFSLPEFLLLTVGKNGTSVNHRLHIKLRTTQTGSASSRRPTTRPRGSGTPPPARRSRSCRHEGGAAVRRLRPRLEAHRRGHACSSSMHAQSSRLAPKARL
jgi:hypothetical protein